MNSRQAKKNRKLRLENEYLHEHLRELRRTRMEIGFTAEIMREKMDKVDELHEKYCELSAKSDEYAAKHYQLRRQQNCMKSTLIGLELEMNDLKKKEIKMAPADRKLLIAGQVIWVVWIVAIAVNWWMA